MPKIISIGKYLFKLQLKCRRCFFLRHTVCICVALWCCERYIFYRPVLYRALSLRNVCIRCPGIIHVLQATFVPNLVSFAVSVAELASGENNVLTHPLYHPVYLMFRESNLSLPKKQRDWLSPRSEAKASGWLVCGYRAPSLQRTWYFSSSLSLRYARVRSSESSSSPKLTLRQISFRSRPPLLS